MKKQLTQDDMFAPVVTAIQDVAEAFRKMNASKVEKKLIVTLIHDQTRLPKHVIETVLNAAANLSKKYLKNN